MKISNCVGKHGRLGNQCFQISAAMGLAEKYQKHYMELE